VWPTLAGDKPLIWNEGAQDATTSGNATWSQDHAIDVTVTSTATGGGLPPGMYEAMVGARVGSQILLVMPPKDGFPSSAAPTGVGAKDTVIMVIDVLGIK
jgi:peptidylprolyl isomerase